jgi:hypothetical protein
MFGGGDVSPLWGLRNKRTWVDGGRGNPGLTPPPPRGYNLSPLCGSERTDRSFGTEGGTDLLRLNRSSRYERLPGGRTCMMVRASAGRRWEGLGLCGRGSTEEAAKPAILAAHFGGKW